MTVANEQFDADDIYYGSCRESFVRLFPQRPQSVLDVGCGRGTYLRLCAARGAHSLVGVELRPDVADLTRSEGWATEIISGSIEDMELERFRGKFDVVIAGFVLEHVVNPWRTLSLLKSMLTDGGNILVSLPNVRFWRVSSGLLLNGSWRYEREGILDWTHLRFFTRQTMNTLFKDTGLLIEETSSEFSSRGATWDRMTRGRLTEFLALGYNFRLRLDPNFDHKRLVDSPNLR